MILPLVKSKMQTDPVADLERKMIKIRVLQKQLCHILDAEYTAGMAYDSKSLKKLILRKRNCVNRFEHFAGSMGRQFDVMTRQKITSSIRSKNLADRVKMVQGLTQKQKTVLLGIATDLEQQHRELIRAASRNGLFFKSVLGRLSATSKYVNHKSMGRTP
nr:hypothetical protein [uncultured Desulfobacter sp.]